MRVLTHLGVFHAVQCRVKVASDKKWFPKPVWVWVTLDDPAFFLRWKVAKERPSPVVAGQTESGHDLIQYQDSEALAVAIVEDVQAGVPELYVVGRRCWACCRAVVAHTPDTVCSARHDAPMMGKKAVIAMMQASCFSVVVQAGHRPMDFQVVATTGSSQLRDKFVQELRRLVSELPPQDLSAFYPEHVRPHVVALSCHPHSHGWNPCCRAWSTTMTPVRVTALPAWTTRTCTESARSCRSSSTRCWRQSWDQPTRSS